MYGIREADMHLVVGLLLTLICKQCEDFQNYLLCDTEVEFRFNKKDYHIRFVGCTNNAEVFFYVVGAKVKRISANSSGLSFIPSFNHS